MVAGMTVILLVATNTKIAFLWHNPIAAAVVVSVGLVVSALTSKHGSGTREQGPVRG
jgi:type IV secretory pathway VirB3-like protein